MAACAGRVASAACLVLTGQLPEQGSLLIGKHRFVLGGAAHGDAVTQRPIGSPCCCAIVPRLWQQADAGDGVL